MVAQQKKTKAMRGTTQTKCNWKTCESIREAMEAMGGNGQQHEAIGVTKRNGRQREATRGNWEQQSGQPMLDLGTDSRFLKKQYTFNVNVFRNNNHLQMWLSRNTKNIFS